ncbi:DUF3575 domain-containing protein [Telluribacter sp.]|jgi:hypothetical protein|uniref:DUF3575 domain-containing protein n=1 Tax=Telluribacter sp. TaxID=1978767 RepID=UPI002E1680B1|nr:DUF3575 domain-containing protein [Telluribacter sp.]
MKRIVFFLLVALAGSISVIAQDMYQYTPTRAPQYPDSLNRQPILKFAPLALFDPDNTLQVGIEIPLPDPRFSVQQEAGYGHSAFNVYPFQREEYPNRETWRFRTQLRMYYRMNESGAGYFAAEYLFKKNSIQQLKSVGMDCASPGQCAYFQTRNVSLGRFVNAFHLKAGWQYYLAPRMNLDVYFGLGMRNLTVRTLGQENEQLRNNSNSLWFGTDQPGRYGPIGSFTFGFHLGWVLGKL